MRRTSSSSKTAEQWKREGKSSVIETFLSLQDLEPEFLTDTVIKSVLSVSRLHYFFSILPLGSVLVTNHIVTDSYV
jgi:hypothetical protein